MSQDVENFKCVSSLAVFRKMYDNRQNVYDIISEFVKTIIISHSLVEFELYDMCTLLKEEYGVWIVPAVVKTALKKIEILKRKKNEYIVEEKISKEDTKRINAQISQSRSSISVILDDYVTYKKTKVRDEDIDEVSSKEEICKFIVDAKITDESSVGIISAFLLERKDDLSFKNACECIREGLIIYNGLSYTPVGELVDKLDTPLTVFLQTELLFHATGLNGTLYYSLFSDFYQVVNDINNDALKRNGKKVISLKYFPETKEEVNRFFLKAEAIFSNQKSLDPSRPAMCAILNGCSSVSDVKQKEIEFWSSINSMGIKEDETVFDVSKSYYAQYNLSGKEEISLAETSEDADKIYEIGQMLSKVNYLRRNVNRGVFRTIHAIILTGNRKTLFLGEKYKSEQEVPLATTLSYLTNRFWYSLHKGIFNGKTTVPGANIITMAQVAFSQKVNESLTDEYNKIKQQFDNGEITKEKACEIIAGFKMTYLQPESVTKEMVDDDFCFDLFNGEAIEQVKAERSLERKKHNDEMASKSKELEDSNRALDALIREKNQNEQQEYEKELNSYSKSLDESVNKQMRKMRNKQLIILALYFMLFMVMVVAAMLSSLKIVSGLGMLVIIISALPVMERFVRPLFNGTIIEAFKWVTSEKTRTEYKEALVEKIEKENPRPELILSNIEDYLRK